MRVSIPCSAPTNKISYAVDCCYITLATAIPGNRCPPVPPPAMMTFINPRSGLSWAGMLRNVQQNSNGGKHYDKRAAAIAQERQRYTLRRHHAEHDTYIDEGLNGNHHG